MNKITKFLYYFLIAMGCTTLITTVIEYGVDTDDALLIVENFLKLMLMLIGVRLFFYLADNEKMNSPDATNKISSFFKGICKKIIKKPSLFCKKMIKKALLFCKENKAEISVWIILFFILCFNERRDFIFNKLFLTLLLARIWLIIYKNKHK